MIKHVWNPDQLPPVPPKQGEVVIKLSCLPFNYPSNQLSFSGSRKQLSAMFYIFFKVKYLQSFNTGPGLKDYSTPTLAL